MNDFILDRLRDMITSFSLADLMVLVFLPPAIYAAVFIVKLLQ